jgi:4-hydroxybutyrate CoA-transferase
MDWQTAYQHRLTTAPKALLAVHSGKTVYIQPGCATPHALIEALVARAPVLQDVEILQMASFGPAPHARPECAGAFRVNSLFIGGNVRDAVQQGRADYTPIFLHEIEELFRSGEKPLDVVLLQVSPPDRNGLMSLGPGVDCTLTAAHCGRHIIAQVNRRMPRTHGDTFLTVRDIDAIVEEDRDLAELPPEEATPEQERIAERVASLIPDGATLQMGIGAIPNSVLACLTDHRDLGMHTEMFTDGIIALVEKGVMTGRLKSLHPGKLVAGFALGTQRLFDFLDDNPLFEFHPIEYVNHPSTIARNDRMVAINSAIQVDLTGQVCADSIGMKPYSGFGGQTDFMRGAAASRGGKPILAMSATACHGQVSRIVPVLEPGAGVVTTRADVHYVVTEYGVAFLHGKTLRQRAEALIAIAAPPFRDQLYQAAVAARWLEPKPSHPALMAQPGK